MSFFPTSIKCFSINQWNIKDKYNYSLIGNTKKTSPVSPQDDFLYNKYISYPYVYLVKAMYEVFWHLKIFPLTNNIWKTNITVLRTPGKYHQSVHKLSVGIRKSITPHILDACADHKQMNTRSLWLLKMFFKWHITYWKYIFKCFG